MKLTKVLALALAVCLLGALAVGCGTTPVDNTATNAPDATQAATEAGGVLVMGTQAGFEPFEYIDEAGEITGFDIELSRLIAAKAGKELQIEDMDFGGLIAALQSGKIDFSAAGMSVTEERKESVDFSEPYYTSRQVIVIPIGSDIQSKADLEGRAISAQEGTTGESMLAEQIPTATISSFKKAVDAAMDVVNGRCDAMVLDEEPSKRIVEANSDKLMILEEEFDREEYAIPVKKGNTELLQLINDTLTEIRADGTYDALMAKYFPEEGDAE